MILVLCCMMPDIAVKYCFSKYFFGVLFALFRYIIYIHHVACHDVIVFYFSSLHHILISYILYCAA